MFTEFSATEVKMDFSRWLLLSKVKLDIKPEIQCVGRFYENQ